MSSTNDPVSEFLAREQSALADLGEDFVAPPSPLPPPANDGTVLTNGGSDFGSGTNLNAMDTNEARPVMVNGTNGSNSPALTSSRTQSRQPEEEPEKIRKWREHQKEQIAEKDKIEEKKKEELRQQAKKELEQFYAQRKAQLEQRKKLNREREAALEEENNSMKSQEGADGGGVVWERVARMIEGGAGVPGATSGKGGGVKAGQGVQGTPGKDTSRMKHLILSYARQEKGEKSPSPEVPKKELDM